jgi:3alpha(or 20beta)-hydroxysteroid dehydrogenase
LKADFTGKVALVTGAGGGIGRAICLEFARAGAKVACVDIDRDQGATTASLVKKEGTDAIFIPADVTRAADVEAYVRETVTRFGRIDAFANNAGFEGAVKPIPEYPEEAFDKVLAINVKGVFLGLKYVLPVMIKQKSGAVVNTASVAGWIGSPGLVAYIASKHAVMGITKTAALEVATQGIRVNAVCPGPINTRMMRSIEAGAAPQDPAAALKQFEATIPDGRYGEPEEVARLVVFLASDIASHITAQSVVIDGGSLAM